jgi:hypothetical protein
VPPDHAVVFACVAAVFYAAHQAGDYWAQTGTQAAEKGLPGRKGRKACVAHVASYTVTLAGFLAVSAWWLGLPLSAGNVAAGLAVSAVTHYAADRRRPLEWFADMLGRSLVPGKGGFYRAGDGLATGAALLDQAWHWCWLLVSALIVAGHS